MHRFSVALAAAVLLATIVAAPVGASPGYTVVASGLANPRGLAFSANGKLYVAEAGQAETSVSMAFPPRRAARSVLASRPPSRG